MSSQFLRAARVTIGPPGSEGVSFDERFRIVFDINKTLEQDANRAEVQIYGLSADTQDRIQSLDNRLTVEAGYQGATKVIAVGDLSSYGTKREPPNSITTVEAGDGLRALTEAQTSVSFAEGVDAERVLRQISEDMSVEVRDVASTISGLFENGFSFDGRSKDALDKIAAKTGLDWSIQDNEIQFAEPGAAALTELVYLSTDTGLIKSPERLDELSAGDVKGEEGGWAFSSLLSPSITPGGLVEIESPRVSSIMRVVSVQHVGDTRGPDWESRVEAVEV